MNRTTLRTSVGMCTYNGSRYLSEQLQSIVAQTRRPGEIVVCDDGSTDNTVAVLKAFAASAPFPVRIFSNEKTLGPAKNFEKALGLCRGEVIFLCDQDDIWQPTKVDRMMQVFEKRPEAVYAFSDAEMIDDFGYPLGRTLWDAVGLSEKLKEFIGPGQLKILLKHNIVTGATLAFRASFRDLVLPICDDWMHDYWIVLLASSVSSGVPVPERLVQYRRHASQVCGWRKMSLLQVCMASLKARPEDWASKVERFHKLLERLDSFSERFSCPPAQRRLLQEKEAHLLTRAKTRSSNGVSRVGRVLVEASTGRYQRFSDSWYSIVRDL